MIYHIRKIDGVVPPIPSELDIIQSDLDLDPQRAADGTLHRNKVAVKMKFELTFPPMDKTSMTSLLNQIKKDSFEVEYEDIFTGAIKTGIFYASADKKASVLYVRGTTNTDVIFNEFKVSLIEY